MSEHQFSRNAVATQRASGDLLSRLYREIGISAVAAALQINAESEAVTMAPALIASSQPQHGNASAIRP